MKSFHNYFISSDGKVFNSKMKELKPFHGISRSGKKYRRIYLYINKVRKSYNVSRLVLMTHDKNFKQYHEADHINRNTLDDRIENLRSLSHRDNQLAWMTLKKVKHSKHGKSVMFYNSHDLVEVA